MKIHKQIYKEGAFGGTLNTTLCGRSNKYSWLLSDGSNVSDKDEEVTCKFCLKLMKLKKEQEMKS